MEQEFVILSVIKYLNPLDTMNLIHSSKYLKDLYDTDIFWNRIVPLPRVTFRLYIKKMVHLMTLMKKYSTIQLMDEITRIHQWEILCMAVGNIYRKQYMIHMLKTFLPDFLQTYILRYNIKKMSPMEMKDAKFKSMHNFIVKHKRRKLSEAKYTPV